MSASQASFQSALPWVAWPLIVSAPMRMIALSPLAVSVTLAKGLGFIGAGTEVADLAKHMAEAAKLLTEGGFQLETSESGPTRLPIGVGVICHGTTPNELFSQLHEYTPAAIWLFAPSKPTELVAWSIHLREALPSVQIWVQVGSVHQAVESCQACPPDVLVVQGVDAGGHGLQKGAGLLSLLPEIASVVPTLDLPRQPAIIATGGIATGESAAAALMLHPSVVGVCLGTRFLASPQANISNGYRKEVLRASDGGQTTVRSGVYDILRGTTNWPADYGGRGITNASYNDWVSGVMTEEENKRRYQEEMTKGDKGWGPQGRMTTYAGTAIGLVKDIQDAGVITTEIRHVALNTLRERASHFS